MTIALQAGIVYGPLKSRRFGESLGINLLPEDQKICNFECVYCQYGESKLAMRAKYPTLEEIKTEVTEALSDAKKNNRAIDWITIAGNGEPTLYPYFSAAIDVLIEARNRTFPGVPIGILSNSSTCAHPEIQEALLKLDGRFMKLDAGIESLFRKINYPAGSARWEEMIAGLHDLKNCTLQSLFFTGGIQNVSEDVVDNWIAAVKYIQPAAVQIYTIDRPPSDESLRPVSREILELIARRLFEKTRIPGHIFDKESC